MRNCNINIVIRYPKKTHTHTHILKSHKGQAKRTPMRVRAECESVSRLSDVIYLICKVPDDNNTIIPFGRMRPEGY